ncbi:hypothetical protein SCHPADRAFT_629441 [Schizopora paradoxa]|uniref:Uncharacterized protein n=1 Tax=Schizopora paradoxa TaxID=27342 RepID=A0A0H2R8Z2_9AGAM|nr:hypothetical protein SCHPADRAFT_629441 [Schizopora paradoxa]
MGVGRVSSSVFSHHVPIQHHPKASHSRSRTRPIPPETEDEHDVVKGSSRGRETIGTAPNPATQQRIAGYDPAWRQELLPSTFSFLLRSSVVLVFGIRQVLLAVTQQHAHARSLIFDLDLGVSVDSVGFDSSASASWSQLGPRRGSGFGILDGWWKCWWLQLVKDSVRSSILDAGEAGRITQTARRRRKSLGKTNAPSSSSRFDTARPLPPSTL